MRNSTLSDVRLTDPDVFVQGVPHDIFRLLRREAPMHWSEGTERFPGFWSITRYDDIIALSRDPMTFISGKGIAMQTNPNDPVQAASLGR